MSYNSSTGIVYAPVNTNIGGDIQQALGVYDNGDIGNTITKAAERGRIRPWAKYKPVQLTAWGTANQLDTSDANPANWRWKQDSSWWRGGNGKCGLNIEDFESLGEPDTQGSFLYKLKNGLLKWNYIAPTSYFRLYDFICYDTNAIRPMGELATKDIWLSTQGDMLISYDSLVVGDFNLKLTDILINDVSLANFYLGVFLWQGTRYHVLTSTNKITENGGLTISIDDAQSLVGTWNMLPFISSVQLTINGSKPTGTYLSFDQAVPESIVIHKAGTIIDIWVYAEWNNDGTAVSYEIVFQSKLTNSRTLTNTEVYLYSTTTPDAQPQTGTLVKSSTVGTVVVPANSTVRRTGTITGLSRNANLTYWIGADTDGDFAINYNQVEEAANVLPEA